MFGFSKKKEQDALAQQSGAFSGQGKGQSTKVEDDMASFEIPDFSDDDLNFDLGIGEFMPEGAPLPPAPKGLPTEPEEKPVTAPVFPQENTSTNKSSTQSISLNNNMYQQGQSPQELKDEDKSLNPTLDNSQSFSQELDKEMEEEEEDDDGGIPKFNVSPSVSYLVEDLPVIEDKKQKSLKSNKPIKPLQSSKNTKEIVKEIKTEKAKEPRYGGRHYAQTSNEGLFVSNDVFRKIVILTEDISKKAHQGETIRNQSVSLSKSRKEILTDVTNTTKAVRDSILLADAKLFEER